VEFSPVHFYSFFRNFMDLFKRSTWFDPYSARVRAETLIPCGNLKLDKDGVFAPDQ
jgi:hypothetical protein